MAKKILVVDDNQDILSVVDMILTEEGYDVETLLDGSQVKDAVAKIRPDLILLDVMLGGIDGRDICRELKSSITSMHIPIIIFSASHDLISSKEQECNADAYVSKPFDIDHLTKKVGEFLD